jgi:hypothetical protein
LTIKASRNVTLDKSIIIMVRPRIGNHVLTPAERQRRRRARLKEKIDPEAFIADVMRRIRRAGVNVGPQIARRLTIELARYRREQRAQAHQRRTL